MPFFTPHSNNTLSLKIFLLSCFCFITIAVHAQSLEQTRQEIEQRALDAKSLAPNFCGTMQRPENKMKSEDIEINHRFMQLRNLGTWNLRDGYGSGCIKDCDLNSVERTPLACTGVGNEIFRIPVAYTLNTTAGCVESVPSQGQLDAQIDMMNDFMACQNIPMEFYQSQTTRLVDAGCVYNASNVTNIPDVVNIYVFSDTGNGTGCNGFAFFPTNPNSPTTTVMSNRCYNSFSYTSGTLDCANPTLGFGLVLIHEIGHYLGLFHTHETQLNAPGDCDDPTTTTDDCTTGDGIADTDADPDFSGEEIGCTGCDTGGANPDCSFDNTLPGCADYGTPNTLNNVMSYNNFSGCRTNFSECQKAKMIDALLCARGPQMCSRDVNAEFAGGAMDANLEICVGDAIPTFTAISNCYNWYDNLGGTATELATGSMTFTPTGGTGAGELDVNTPGVYTWYLGDVNEVNVDCRTAVTVTVLADSGTGTGNGSSMVSISDCTGPQDVTLSSSVATLGENCVIGWWVTEDNPISATVTDNASLNTALGNVTIGGTLSNTANNLYESTTGTPIKEFTLPFDCSTLDDTKTYYATPVVAKSKEEVPDQTCVVNAGPTTDVTFNGFPGQYTSIVPGDVCAPNPVNTPPTFTYCITVSGYTGNPSNLSIVIRDDNFNGNNLIVDFFVGTGDGNATYCYTNTQFSMPSYDPGNPDLNIGMTGIVWEQGGNGAANVTLSTTLDITYSGEAAIPFPSIASYNDCLFGAPVQLNCSCNAAICEPNNGTLSITISN